MPFWIALHIADPDPGQIGGRAENEVSYRGYERVPVTRLPSGDWTIGGKIVSGLADSFEIRFHESTEPVTDIRYWSASTEAGQMVFAGRLQIPIYGVGVGVTPCVMVSDLDALYERCKRAGDVIALVSMRGIIADAAGHPGRDAALRAFDRLARLAQR